MDAYQIKAKAQNSQNRHTAKQFAENDWTVYLRRFQKQAVSKGSKIFLIQRNNGTLIFEQPIDYGWQLFENEFELTLLQPDESVSDRV